MALALIAVPPLRRPLVSWSVPTGVPPGWTNGNRSRRAWWSVPPPKKTFLISGNVRLAERPVEAQFLVVGLLDLDKFGLDFDLRGDIAGWPLRDNRIDQIQLILRIPHDEPAGARQIDCRCGAIELDAIGDQPVLGGFLRCDAAAALRRISRGAALSRPSLAR